MGEHILSPEFEERIRSALGGTQARPEFVRRLEQGLRARAARMQGQPAGRSQRLAWRWALAVLLVLILLGVLVVGPANLAAAMQRLLGYIPGIGLVEEAGGLRVLAAPVSVERDGITVTVEQAVVDSERTIVLVKVDGIPPEARPQSEDAPACYQNPELLPPDGDAREMMGGSGAWGKGDASWRGDVVSGGGQGRGSGYSWRMVFAALPAEVERAILHVPCLFDTAPGQAPEAWSLQLVFLPAPGPVLERVIEQGNWYVLVGAFRLNQGVAGGTFPPEVEVTMADGRAWPWNWASDVNLPLYRRGVIPWAYVVPKGFTPPLTLTFAKFDVEVPVDGVFEIHVGSTLTVGERLRADHPLLLGEHVVRLVAVTRTERGYELQFESDESVFGITAASFDPVEAWGGWSGADGEFYYGFDYAPPIPTGSLRFRVTALRVSVSGPWAITWSPPLNVVRSTPPAPPSACLTLEGWQQILAQPPVEQPALTGKLIGESGNVVFLVDLQTGQRRNIGAGNWPDLSSDGRFAAYSGTRDGLHVVDLSTGEDRIIPGTMVNDYNPRWSPDGTWLAFRRNADRNLYRVRPDGSGLERLTQGPEYKLLMDWTSDASGLYFGVPAGAASMRLRLLDLATGTAGDLFTINSRDVWGRSPRMANASPTSLECPGRSAMACIWRRSMALSLACSCSLVTGVSPTRCGLPMERGCWSAWSTPT